MADAAKIIMTLGDAPATPAVGTVVLYSKADKKYYFKDSDGVETALEGADGVNGLISPVLAGGTVDAITVDYTPNIALDNFTVCTFEAIGANTSATPTFAPDGLTAHTIVKKGGTALVAGDIPGEHAICILEYNLAHTRWELLNPAVSGVTFSTAAEILTGTEAAKAIAPDQAKKAGLVDRWTQTTGTFTAAPASTSTLTMTTDLTASIKVGMSLKYAIGGVTYYGRVAAIAANLLTVNGAPLGGDVTALYYNGGWLREVVVIIPGPYEDASNTALITSDLTSNLLWWLPTSYLVYFSVYSNVHDSGGTHGQASVRINGTEVNTTAGGELIAANTTWYPTVVNIATAAYDINPGELLEVTAVKGTTGDASNLTVHMIFLTP
jgi:hypothetical protein